MTMLLRGKTCTLLRTKTAALLRRKTWLLANTMETKKGGVRAKAARHLLWWLQSTCSRSQRSACVASQQSRCLGCQQSAYLAYQHVVCLASPQQDVLCSRNKMYCGFTITWCHNVTHHQSFLYFENTIRYCS